MNITQKEIIPGLVVFCDPAILAAHNSTWTSDTQDKCVQGPHFFLVIEPHRRGAWLMMPVFSRSANERFALDQASKSGPSNGWRTKDSFVYRWEQWLVHPEAMVAASAPEQTRLGLRNGYALRDPERLQRLATLYQANAKPLIHTMSGELVDFSAK